jgi:protein-disulfide isomerase
VFRHLPLVEVHPDAELAAQAAEAAGAQGRFWEMHDRLFAHQDALQVADLLRYADEIGLDVDRFADDLRDNVHERRVADDAAGAEASGVEGTPTFFIGGRRHTGPFDAPTIVAALEASGPAQDEPAPVA